MNASYNLGLGHIAIYYLVTFHVEPNKDTCMPLSQRKKSHRHDLPCGLLPW